MIALLCSQHVSAQIVIGQPNLGFSQACASESFNTYEVSFVFSPESNLGPSNTFTVELSDGNGDFSNSVAIFTTDPGEVNSSPATLTFSLPQDTAGENYQIRIKSSAPAATSTPSNAFAAYYKLQDEPFTINNLVENAAFCAGGSYLLAIDNPGTGNNDSPLNYPSLTFKWYKETSPTTAEFVSDGTTLEVTSEGTYFVETDYGSCTSDSFSNRVTVVEVTSGEAEIGISSSLGNPFCPSNGATTLSTITGESYQWFKDGTPIADATDQMYEASESGFYEVQVDLGDCATTGEIQLENELFDAEINVSEINFIDDDESLFVMITTNAITPEFEWYFNDVLITDAFSDSYEVIEFGDYKVRIVDLDGTCDGSREFFFEVREAFPNVDKIPSIVTPNGDGINDTWVIPQKYVSGSNTIVQILSNRGEIIFQTSDYQNNWPENTMNPMPSNQVFYYVITTSTYETKKGSITLIK